MSVVLIIQSLSRNPGKRLNTHRDMQCLGVSVSAEDAAHSACDGVRGAAQDQAKEVTVKDEAEKKDSRSERRRRGD